MAKLRELGTATANQLYNAACVYSLAGWMRVSGLGDAPRTVLDEMKKLKSGDVTLRARSPRDGSAGADRQITLRCVTEPDAGQSVLLQRLGLALPRRLRRLDDVTRM